MNKIPGFVLIMFAASLWALDALLRTHLTFAIPSIWIVFFEHLAGVLLFLPVLYNSRSVFNKLKKRDWMILLLMTIVSSVLGTLLFTEALNKSFAVGDFASPVLLQKLQPMFVIMLSTIFLKEVLSYRFLLLAVVALIGSYMISFGTDSVFLDFSSKLEVSLLAVGAAVAWGAGTVMSKHLLTKVDAAPATALRMLLAVPISFAVALLIGQDLQLSAIGSAEILRIILIALSTGAVAILIYYKGLIKTKASVSAFAELAFPVASIFIAISVLNPYGQPQTLTLANSFGVIILLISILLISTENESKKSI
ncbi:MAG: DMT family transporter [Candidatus Dojkabacteria bacterium]|uniref:EamA-like transporter family protein n=2 Tax=Candidatus Dojkabacteria TaxID=74243 RepID=A0A136KKD4_9BACT|nr:MAG: EamA-like transporter family protein [candidate division WS6 bacterium OLB21]MBW7953872.1 DMT family transporter [Candidatus Dojkabacteria bacterium]WKZ27999.1 MAG: DMT family transporter [Candidatus Dojkabacteria bacterium]